MKFNSKWISFPIILLFSVFPLFFSLPFRIHLDLPWEGTYRLYSGQIPYRDFGMPFGYGFFILPLLSFFIFGPFLKSLLIAQAIMNIISGFTFRALLRQLHIDEEKIVVSVFIFSLSYTFLYFWPWYNHTAFTYQMLGLLFLLKSFKANSTKSILGYISLSTFFIFLTFFTKQDYGGLAFLLAFVIVVYYCIISSRWIYAFSYLGGYTLWTILFIVPLLQFGFGYWFNYGQPPHSSRLEPFTFLNEFMMNSQWEKFYLLLILLIVIKKITDHDFRFKDADFIIGLLIATGMIAEVLITKITSKNSLTNTTYFHGFAVAIILTQVPSSFIPKSFRYLPIILAAIFIWWSGEFWKYSGRIFKLGNNSTQQSTSLDSIHQVKNEGAFQQSWKASSLRSFKGVKLPAGTIEGIDRLKKMELFTRKDVQVLNMTELTPLAYELGYVPIKGLPLWYHKNVIFFPKQVDELCGAVQQKSFDIVLFEIVPALDGFFPEEVRQCLQKEYKLIDTFVAPRKEGDSSIEVYIRSTEP